MRINIKTVGTDLTQAIKLYTTDKLTPLAKLLDESKGEAMLDVELDRTTAHHNKGDIYRVKLNLRAGRISLRAEDEGSDMYAVIDLVRDEISREIKATKTRKESLFRRGARTIKKILKGN